MTKIDVLDGLPEIRVGTGYQIDGRVTNEIPADLSVYGRAKPVYVTLPGWSESTAGARRYEDLPGACRDYLGFIADFLGVPVAVASVGPARDQTIVIDGPF
jgi:adenylosuccinate synthase